MKPKPSSRKTPTKTSAEAVVKDIRRQTRRHFSAEDKIRIVLDGLRGEDSIAELCRREGTAQSLYYTWLKEFMEGRQAPARGRHRSCCNHGQGPGSAPRSTGTQGMRGRSDVGKPPAEKKHDRGWGRRRMRYPAAEKLEIISPAYIVIKAAEQFHTKTTRPTEMWQTDFTYFKIIGWGWMYLSTVLDDFSHDIIAWKLCTNMRAEDVTETLDLALKASGCDCATVLHEPRLLSDNGPSYIAGELAEYIEAQHMSQVRGAPLHPQTQGQIERWHQTLKNRILLEHYFLPGDLEAPIEAFVEHYNHQRYHECLNTVPPAAAYFGRALAIIKRRETITRKTIEHRRLLHRKLAA